MKRGVPHRIRAEQALLGAVLCDPAGQAHLLDLVDAGDMTRPYHAQVLEAMQRLRARGVEPGPLAVHEEIKRDPDMPRHLAHDGVVLADLMEAPPRSAHGPAYAAMVIGTGIRHRITLTASRMRQAASSGDPADAVQTAAEVRRELDRCQQRWDALPEEMRRELPAPTRDQRVRVDVSRELRAVREEIRRLRQDLSTESPYRLEGQLASIAQHVADAAAASADRSVQRAETPGTSRRVDPAAEAAATRTLRELADAPSQIAAIRGWLHPRHFTSREHGDVYAVMCDLQAVGKPVDPVTVSWEAERRGVHIDAADLDGGVGLFAVDSARDVHRGGVLAQADQAGRDIQATAHNAGASPAQVLRSADERLRRVELIADRPESRPAARPDRHPNGHARTAPRAEPAAEPEQAPEAVR